MVYSCEEKGGEICRVKDADKGATGKEGGRPQRR